MGDATLQDIIDVLTEIQEHRGGRVLQDDVDRITNMIRHQEKKYQELFMKYLNMKADNQMLQNKMKQIGHRVREIDKICYKRQISRFIKEENVSDPNVSFMEENVGENEDKSLSVIAEITENDTIIQDNAESSSNSMERSEQKCEKSEVEDANEMNNQSLYTEQSNDVATSTPIQTVEDTKIEASTQIQPAEDTLSQPTRRPYFRKEGLFLTTTQGEYKEKNKTSVNFETKDAIKKSENNKCETTHVHYNNISSDEGTNKIETNTAMTKFKMRSPILNVPRIWSTEQFRQSKAKIQNILQNAISKKFKEADEDIIHKDVSDDDEMKTPLYEDITSDEEKGAESRSETKHHDLIDLEDTDERWNKGDSPYKGEAESNNPSVNDRKEMNSTSVISSESSTTNENNDSDVMMKDNSRAKHRSFWTLRRETHKSEESWMEDISEIDLESTSQPQQTTSIEKTDVGKEIMDLGTIHNYTSSSLEESILLWEEKNQMDNPGKNKSRLENSTKRNDENDNKTQVIMNKMPYDTIKYESFLISQQVEHQTRQEDDTGNVSTSIEGKNCDSETTEDNTLADKRKDQLQDDRNSVPDNVISTVKVEVNVCTIEKEGFNVSMNTRGRRRKFDLVPLPSTEKEVETEMKTTTKTNAKRTKSTPSTDGSTTLEAPKRERPKRNRSKPKFLANNYNEETTEKKPRTLKVKSSKRKV